MLLTAALLQLKLKQKCIEKVEQSQLEQESKVKMNILQSADNQDNKQADATKNTKCTSKKITAHQQSRKQKKVDLKERDWQYFPPQKKVEDFAYDEYMGSAAGIYIKVAGNIFSKLWKISKAWLETLQNLLTRPFDVNVINMLAAP